MTEFWEFNKESIYLAAVVSVVSGILWPIFHEVTKWAIFRIKDRISK